MTGGNTRSRTSSGASSTVGNPGTSAKTTPVRTKRMAGGILRRAATSATTATTTSSNTRIWIVGIMSAPIGDDDRTRAQEDRSVLLRQHPILGLEVMSGMGDELRVAWMIDGFHTDDNLHQPGIMLADVLDQLGFGIGRPRNENCAGVRDRFSDSLKKGVILRGVPTPDGVCLVVDVLGRTIRVQHEPFHISRAEMEHARLMVIDPNDRMIVMAVHRVS